MLDSEVYNAAIAVIESGWTQNAFARDAAGHSTNPCGSEAKSWCLGGALIAVLDASRYDKVRRLNNEKRIIELAENLGLPDGREVLWNDDPNRTKEHVVRLLQKAATLSYILEGE